MSRTSAWRIDETAWTAQSLRGEGAARDGGRWNSRGVKVVYASENLAMAALEKYGNLPMPLPAKVEFSPSWFDFDSLRIPDRAGDDPAESWDSLHLGKATQRLGDAWVNSAETAILRVPSAVLKAEANFVLNPSHPDYAKIRVETSKRFDFPGRRSGCD